ncbi:MULTISPECIES: PAS domain-containing sensor histidine kinase [unclassified Leeuwenhoekiella]|uniref:PAS domain-containing sensor histidine kinase n=1 Tax=unclassified Leeuwenhoekiella TaxID=2615029 RepID=UPI000C588D50|nr:MULTISPECIES: PAS domain-containing sensor histidine kinase [unclassified Leeuwenhoekiella]MAW97031.1 PAS domain-containing sensor histidine kinase [Leeuwenhoekiella sp.]MBA80688.1 PAS domain-containing sensor histidine kinase [Leeuwenhoekiella sp.]|tara:strand:- start:44470 stop:46446 length:1977 start_codon:yes stop_codon:yes gene_type:complete
MSNKQLELYERALARERAARKEAERILEEKSRELYYKSEELKKTNQKLESLVHTAHSELQGVFGNIADAYVMMNLEGVPIKMNSVAEELLGYTVEDHINLYKLVVEEDQHLVSKSFEKLVTTGAITNFEINIRRSNDEIRCVQINASVIYDPANKPLAAQGIVRDITLQKQSEQELIDSQNRLSTLILNLESGVLLEDENRNIVITNKRFCDFFSIPVPPELLQGQNCEQAAEQSKDLFENPEDFVSRINELLVNKEQVLADELSMRDGRVLERDFIPIYEDGYYKGHLWTYRDVTLRRKYRESIEAERQKYSNIIANMNLGLIEVNNDDEILMINQSLEEMSGYTEAELLGEKGMDILLYPGDRDKLNAENESRQHGASNSYEIRARRKNGELRHWLISGAPNYNINGKVVGSIGIHLDITDLKNLELQKENLLRKLEKSNDELQEYAHVVSHDLKSPLRSLSALVDWIREDNRDCFDEQTFANFGLIDQTLEKMEQLISDVLNYSSMGIENSKREQVPVKQVLDDIRTLIHIPEHIKLTYPENLPVLLADRVKLQQLFQNLIGNAIAYCDKNPGWVQISWEEQQNVYLFKVSDNGVGIAPEYHDKIFKIFQSLQKRKESTGVGLSIVKKIVELYNGKIWLESTPGEGTTFYFTLVK